MDKIDYLAEIIWDYLQMHHTLQKADAILVLGSHDLRVAKRGAELFLQGWAPLMVFSGGYGRFSKDKFSKPEAEVFADVASKMGVSAEKIIIENKSTNSGENAVFTKNLLKEKGLKVKQIILVQKPYMERRAWATFKKQWPEVEVITTSPQISYEDYPKGYIGKDAMISVMVGDLQRVIEYPKRGYQIEQIVPKDVLDAYNQLISLGFVQYLVS